MHNTCRCFKKKKLGNHKTHNDCDTFIGYLTFSLLLYTETNIKINTIMNHCIILIYYHR